MDRDCDRCVYSTRSGGCRSWSCNFKTVEDIEVKAKKDVLRDIDEYKNLTNSDRVFIVNDEWVKNRTEQIRADVIAEFKDLGKLYSEIRADAIDKIKELAYEDVTTGNMIISLSDVEKL